MAGHQLSGSVHQLKQRLAPGKGPQPHGCAKMAQLVQKPVAKAGVPPESEVGGRAADD